MSTPSGLVFFVSSSCPFLTGLILSCLGPSLYLLQKGNLRRATHLAVRLASHHDLLHPAWDEQISLIDCVETMWIRHSTEELHLATGNTITQHSTNATQTQHNTTQHRTIPHSISHPSAHRDHIWVGLTLARYHYHSGNHHSLRRAADILDLTIHCSRKEKERETEARRDAETHRRRDEETERQTGRQADGAKEGQTGKENDQGRDKDEDEDEDKDEDDKDTTQDNKTHDHIDREERSLLAAVHMLVARIGLFVDDVAVALAASRRAFALANGAVNGTVDDVALAGDSCRLLLQALSAAGMNAEAFLLSCQAVCSPPTDITPTDITPTDITPTDITPTDFPHTAGPTKATGAILPPSVPDLRLLSLEPLIYEIPQFLSLPLPLTLTLTLTPNPNPNPNNP